MEWQQPQWLYLIVPLGVAWLALAVYSRRRRRRAAEAFVAQTMWDRILPADSPARFWVKTLLREVALVAALVALAGPRFGTQYEEVIPRGSDLYVLIDVSRSMLAEDVPPSRLGRAKADVAALVNRLEGERIGLIAFAGQAVVKCPLTVDYDAFRRSLDELDPDSAPRGGTAIGDAIRKALEVFHAQAGRDQAILLITDGDDQESYPLEAAAAAAERHVTVFTVGLGDADQGARIPNSRQARSYLEYHGSQVWTKLNGTLLKEIALKTSGVYVPVGTRSYDLGELYAKYLQGRRAGDALSQKRIRRADRFQIFLALALLALLADAFTPAYPSTTGTHRHAVGPPASERPGRRSATVSVPIAALLIAGLTGTSRADSSADAIREGLRWYDQGDFAKAKEKFAAAREGFDRADAAKAAVAAFDEACAAHRKGDFSSAREWYLKAGLAHDKRLAASAHYNLGTLAAEEARRLAGDHPENVAADKRPEILEQLKGAVASFRHTLELQPDNAHARRDIELVRQWIKYYSDKWQSLDREKRRKETNLASFLEYLIETQRGLRESVKAAAIPTTTADAFAELKRLQDELGQEIGPLKEKIEFELRPQQAAGTKAAPAPPQEVERGIALLQGWANTAGEKMLSAAQRLDSRQPEPAARDQQQAIDELEKIWDAVIAFHPLLARDLADETEIAQVLAPSATDTTPASQKPPTTSAPPQPQERASKDPGGDDGPPSLAAEGEDLAVVGERQERTLRRTQLLKLKAEAELERIAKEPPPAQPAPDAKGQSVDPKQLKAGYQKAIELGPKAVEQMEKAIKSLKVKDRRAAYAPAEQARKILEEIQKAQPKNEQQNQQPQDQKDQKKKDEEQKKQDQQKNEQQKKDQQKKDQQKKDQEKKEQEQKKQANQGKSDEQKQEPKQPQPQVSRDRIEEALRKVRERQQQKRERDRQMKIRVMEKVPVEKDW
jgi:Ca-activated chloride channel family protein